MRYIRLPPSSSPYEKRSLVLRLWHGVCPQVFYHHMVYLWLYGMPQRGCLIVANWISYMDSAPGRAVQCANTPVQYWANMGLATYSLQTNTPLALYNKDSWQRVYNPILAQVFSTCVKHRQVFSTCNINTTPSTAVLTLQLSDNSNPPIQIT